MALLQHGLRIILQACQLAIDKGWAINIGGGFSHESANEPIGGFHIYDDLLVCLAVSYVKFHVAVKTLPLCATHVLHVYNIV